MAFDNFLDSILNEGPAGYSGYADTAGAAASVPQMSVSPRVSLWDKLNNVGDAFMLSGSADPAGAWQDYEQNKLQNKRLAQEDDYNSQLRPLKLAGARGELEDHTRERMGLALGSLINSPDAANDWPMLAEQASIPPDKAAAIGKLIAEKPGLIPNLAASFGYKPAAEGSKSGDVAFADYLEKNAPGLLPAYLQSKIDGKPMNEYQRSQIGRQERDYRRRIYEWNNPRAVNRKLAR